MDDLRKMGPLAVDHSLVQDKKPCTACHKAFAAGDSVTLIALGPGDDSEGRERARNGRPYNAVAAVVHWACATGEE